MRQILIGLCCLAWFAPGHAMEVNRAHLDGRLGSDHVSKRLGRRYGNWPRLRKSGQASLSAICANRAYFPQ